MPVFENFAENGELLSTSEEILTELNLDRYIKEHGVEKTQGYLEALVDITKVINSFRYEQKENHTLVRSPTSFRKMVWELIIQEQHIIEIGKESLASKLSLKK